MHPWLYNKQEKDFKKEEVKQIAWKEIAKELDPEHGKVVEQLWKSVKSVVNQKRLFCFLFFPDAFYIDVETKIMMSAAVNNVYLPSLCSHERIFSSKLGDNISLVWWEWVGDRSILGDIKITPWKCRYRLGIKVAIVLIFISKKVSPGENQALRNILKLKTD